MLLQRHPERDVIEQLYLDSFVQIARDPQGPSWKTELAKLCSKSSVHSLVVRPCGTRVFTHTYLDNLATVRRRTLSIRMMFQLF